MGASCCCSSSDKKTEMSKKTKALGEEKKHDDYKVCTVRQGEEMGYDLRGVGKDVLSEEIEFSDKDKISDEVDGAVIEYNDEQPVATISTPEPQEREEKEEKEENTVIDLGLFQLEFLREEQ